MVEYIDREDAIRMLRGSAIAKYPLSFSFGIFASADELKKLPAADVAPVRHGKWLEWFPGDCALIMTGEEMLYRCSSCDAKYSDAEEYKYCPYCGAKMDLRRSDDGT